MRLKDKRGQAFLKFIFVFAFIGLLNCFCLSSINATVEDNSQKQEISIESKTDSTNQTTDDEQKNNTEEKIAIPDVKKVNTIYINDKANLLSESTKQDLLKIGTDLDNKYKAQIAVYTIDSLNGETIEDYANKLFRKLGIGDKEKNNGVLILVAKNDHKARIEVGYGLEGAIPDGKAGRILKSMLNEFKKDKYDEGIKLAYGKLANEIYKAHGDEAQANVEEDNNDLTFMDCVILAILVIIIILVIIAFICGSGGSGGGYYGGSSSWSSGDSGGSWGGGSSGGGGASGGW